MKCTILAAATYAAACLAPSHAFAHDQSLHRGKATEGTIVSTAPGRFLVKTDDGERPVSYGAKSKIEIGNDAGTDADLKAGSRVAVFGTKLPGGEIAAKEILLRKPGADQSVVRPHQGTDSEPEK
jgi:hypothetical protein